ncbi:MAG: chemotaxis protein CheB [Phototrophicaceae bacterium]
MANSNYDLVVIGGSAGAIQPLMQILRELPENFRAAILITIHINASTTSNLPQVLGRHTHLPLRYPDSGERIIPGHIYVAPPDLHLVVIDGHLLLRGGPQENRHRPAIDPLFRSAAQRHGKQVIGLLLSGTMDDGTVGMLEINAHGGWTIVQDPQDAQFGDMPQSAINYSHIDDVLPASQIADRLKELVQEEVTIFSAPYTKDPTIDITSLEDILLHEIVDQPGKVSDFACPECGASLWQINQNGFLRFRCHIGHSFTNNTLIAKQSEAIEMYQWQLLRVLKERYTLRKQLIENYRKQDKLQDSMNIEREMKKDGKRLEAIENDLRYKPSLINQ